MRTPAVLGMVWLAALTVVPGGLAGWSLPLLLGLLAAVPLTVFGSRTSWGDQARRFRLC